MSTTALTGAPAPATSSPAAKAVALALTETRLMLRNRTVAVSSVFLPIALGAMFAYTFSSNIDGEVASAVVFASLVASQIAVVVGMTVYVTATQTVVARRHSLVLKRMRTSGLQDGGLLAATLTPCVVIALVQLLLFVPFDLYIGVSGVADPLALLLAVLGGLVLAVTAALATTAVTPTPERAQITTLPMVFVLLGAAIAVSVLPTTGWWQALAAVPGASVGLLVRFAFLGDAWDTASGLPAVLPALVALVVWPVVFGVLARRSFRWEPRR